MHECKQRGLICRCARTMSGGRGWILETSVTAATTRPGAHSHLPGPTRGLANIEAVVNETGDRFYSPFRATGPAARAFRAVGSGVQHKEAAKPEASGESKLSPQSTTRTWEAWPASGDCAARAGWFCRDTLTYYVGLSYFHSDPETRAEIRAFALGACTALNCIYAVIIEDKWQDIKINFLNVLDRGKRWCICV